MSVAVNLISKYFIMTRIEKVIGFENTLAPRPKIIVRSKDRYSRNVKKEALMNGPSLPISIKCKN